MVHVLARPRSSNVWSCRYVVLRAHGLRGSTAGVVHFTSGFADWVVSTLPTYLPLYAHMAPHRSEFQYGPQDITQEMLIFSARWLAKLD